VSVTQFEVRRIIDLPRIIWSGWTLKQRWGELPGAIGTWLWADLRRKRLGSVSIWRSEADMRNFVRWEPHAEIVRRNRQAGQILSTSWTTAELNNDALRSSAIDWLSNANPNDATGNRYANN
jgi:heme-degrading monooxygenase HmoA